MFEIYDEAIDNLTQAYIHETDMNNSEDRTDSPGDNHPVCPEMREISTNLSASDKWQIAGCIAVLIIMAVIMVFYA